MDGTGANAFTAGYFMNDATTAATTNANDFVYKTATESNVSGSSEGVELIIGAGEISDNGSNIRVEYELNLVSYNG